MNLYFVACLVLSAVICRTEGCCAPDQWEGKIGGVGGVARRSIFYAPKLITGLMSLSYDASNRRTVTTTYTEKAGVVKFIANFPRHRAYVIHDTSCKYFNLTKPFKKMCTDGTTSYGPMTMGAGSATILLDSFNFKAGELQGYGSAVRDGCVPCSEGYFGKIKRDHVVISLGYFNITMGIKDPSIFNPPSSCEPATEEYGDLLDDLDVSLGMRMTVHRFNGDPEPAEKCEGFMCDIVQLFP